MFLWRVVEKILQYLHVEVEFEDNMMESGKGCVVNTACKKKTVGRKSIKITNRRETINQMVGCSLEYWTSIVGLSKLISVNKNAENYLSFFDK